jgi:transketolase
MDNSKIKELKQKAKLIREGILDCIGVGKKGHLGGSMSSADLVAALYFYKMRINPNNPHDPDRDRFIFSKGHSVLAQYAALAELGFFPKSELKHTKELGSILQGHPEIRTPGVEANTGSLGQGLSIGIGMALAAKLDRRESRVYVIVGDGELCEGQIWEAVTCANFYKLDNLVAIVDKNRFQASGSIKERYNIGDVKARFDAYGWKTLEIDGHNMTEIVNALDQAELVKESPCAIIANTTKGKGVSFAENDFSFHNNSLTKEQYEQARKDLASIVV